VLASSPLDQDQLHLGKESKLIKHTLDSARNRDQFRVVSCAAATADDLRAYILEYAPTVVHFCGHGAGMSGLCFEDPDGKTHLVSGASLAKLFHLVSEDVKCVVLNACYSDEQARPISEHIDFVVGMRDEMGDAAALKFAEGFYQALWAGQSFERAFKFGCSAIDTAGLPDEQIPILLRSPRLGGLSLSYDERVQEVENFLLRYVNSSMEERIALTVEGAVIAGIIMEFYQGVVFRKWSVVNVLGIEKLNENDLAVVAAVRRGAEAAEHIYYLKQTPGSLQVYWKATIGYWEISAQTLLALGSPEPVMVRAIASIGDYYNFGYTPEEYVSVDLRELDGKEVAGYMARSHPQVKELVAVLRDGRKHRITLMIQPGYPGHRLAEIMHLVSRSWIAPGDQREAGTVESF
jgi:hypothetical protein